MKTLAMNTQAAFIDQDGNFTPGTLKYLNNIPSQRQWFELMSMAYLAGRHNIEMPYNEELEAYELRGPSPSNVNLEKPGRVHQDKANEQILGAIKNKILATNTTVPIARYSPALGEIRPGIVKPYLQLNPTVQLRADLNLAYMAARFNVPMSLGREYVAFGSELDFGVPLSQASVDM